MLNGRSAVSTINDRVRRGRHRDEQLDLQLAMHSAELVKIKILFVKAIFSADSLKTVPSINLI